MFTNRFILVIGVLSLLLVAMAVSAPLFTAPSAEDLSLPRRPVFPTSANGYHSVVEKVEPYSMDSATRSYIAWGKALQAAGKLGNSAACSTITRKNIFKEIDSNLDSATRSYIAWGLALQAKNDKRTCP